MIFTHDVILTKFDIRLRLLLYYEKKMLYINILGANYLWRSYIT